MPGSRPVRWALLEKVGLIQTRGSLRGKSVSSKQKRVVAMVTEEVLVAHRDSGKRTKRNLRVGVCGAVGRKAGRMTRRADRVRCVLCIDQGREHQVLMLQRR